MPTLRQRVANLLLGDERERLQDAIAALAEVRHYVMSPQAMVDRLAGGNSNGRISEVDDQLIQLLLSQSGFMRVGGPGGWGGLEALFSETNRRAAVIDSRYMYHMDVAVSAACAMWTDFGFGQSVSIAPNDEALAEVFDECFAALRNRSVFGEAKIHENSERVIVDGEVFYAVWASTLDGLCTIRRFKTEEITDVLTHPDDRDVPLWYVGADSAGQAVYYADWRAAPDDLSAVPLPQGALRADDLRPATRVVIVPAQRNVIGKRGWPQLRQTLVWARAYRDFLGDRATVAKKAALRVEKITAKNAGQRTIDSIVARMQSELVNQGVGLDRNQNTTAGQTWVQNEGVDLQWMNRDTGAQAAQIDGLTLLGQFASGARVPLGWLGRPDAWQNRAVAKEASLPWYEQIQRYQTFWSSVFSDLVQVVGRMANQYGRQSIEDFACEVGLDSPFQNDIDEIAAIMGAITGAVAGGTLDAGAASRSNLEFTRLALLSLGIRNAEAVLAKPEDDMTAAERALLEEIRLAREELRAALSEAQPYPLHALPSTSETHIHLPDSIASQLHVTATARLDEAALGAAMREAVSTLPAPQVNLTPIIEQDAPQVVVNMPTQPAPQVNVSVQPTPITNTVNVPRQRREKSSVRRDAQGHLTGTDTEIEYDEY